MKIDYDIESDYLTLILSELSIIAKLNGTGWKKLTGHVTIEEIQLELYLDEEDGSDSNISFYNKYKDKLDKLTFKDIQEHIKDLDLNILCIHDGSWEIYNDKSFEKSVSDFLGTTVTFTEQGMQESNLASMAS